MPSYGGAQGPDGSKKSGDQGQGSRDSRGGNTGGAKGQEGSGFGGSKQGGAKSNPASKAIPGFRNVALANAGLPQQPGYGPQMNSRGNGGKPTQGTRTVPSYPGSSILDPTKMPSWGAVIDSVINGTNYDGMNGTTDITTRDLGFGGLQGGTGARDDRAFFENKVNPPAGSVAPVTPDTSTKTLDDYLNEIKAGFVNPNARYYLEQRGLIDPSAPAGIPADWQPTFDRYYDFIKSTLPGDIVAGNPKEADVFNKLRTYFTDQFGDTALTNEQNRRRNEYTGALQGKGFESQIDSAFGDTADDDLINSILQPQYQAAQDVITNQQKRGTLTPSGYQYALNRLGDQRTAGLNKLQGIGQSEREKLGGGVRDYLSSIYGKAGEYNLGQQFDPNSFDTEFGNRLSSASGSLEGNIRAAAPTNLFDTASVQQDAGNVQGQTSRGGLLDTLASRRRSGSRQRGLGTTGSF